MREEERKREDRERGKRERGVCGSGGGKGMTRESIEKAASSIGISQSGMHGVNETSISMSECVRHNREKQSICFYALHIMHV